jgi:hypothetical protein
MSHQAHGRHSGCREHHQELKRALKWLFKGADFSGIQWREDCQWSILGLVMTAVLWAWSGERTLGDRFIQARRITRWMLGTKDVPRVSYQAFIKLLGRWTTALILELASVFRRRMETAFGDRWRIAGFAPFGVDGSRFDLPRTASNEARFSRSRSSESGQTTNRKHRRRRARYKQSAVSRVKKANTPQMWVTTVWHLGIGLSWSWRLGPSNSSERDHLRAMLAELPKSSLLVADAGFCSYILWRELLAAGHHLLVRVGSNVRLLKKLGYVKEKKGIVYFWPDYAASKSQPPIVLRLIVVHNGKHPVYLLTSVVDEKRFSNAEVIETYSLRWGVELFYRHVKQTFERRKLRSHSPDNALLEAHWSLIGLWAITIHAQYELQICKLEPRRLSIARMLKAYRIAMNEYKSTPDKGDDLRSQLKRALRDTYKRKSKASRDYPRKKREQSPGAPWIIVANKKQIQKAREIKREFAKGLTA